MIPWKVLENQRCRTNHLLKFHAQLVFLMTCANSEQIQIQKEQIISYECDNVTRYRLRW